MFSGNNIDIFGLSAALSAKLFRDYEAEKVGLSIFSSSENLKKFEKAIFSFDEIEKTQNIEEKLKKIEAVKEEINGIENPNFNEKGMSDVISNCVDLAKKNGEEFTPKLPLKFYKLFFVMYELDELYKKIEKKYNDKGNRDLSIDDWLNVVETIIKELNCDYNGYLKDIKEKLDVGFENFKNEITKNKGNINDINTLKRQLCEFLYKDVYQSLSQKYSSERKDGIIYETTASVVKSAASAAKGIGISFCNTVAPIVTDHIPESVKNAVNTLSSGATVVTEGLNAACSYIISNSDNHDWRSVSEFVDTNYCKDVESKTLKELIIFAYFPEYYKDLCDKSLKVLIAIANDESARKKIEGFSITVSELEEFKRKINELQLTEEDCKLIIENSKKLLVSGQNKSEDVLKFLSDITIVDKTENKIKLNPITRCYFNDESKILYGAALICAINSCDNDGWHMYKSGSAVTSAMNRLRASFVPEQQFDNQSIFYHRARKALVIANVIVNLQENHYSQLEQEIVSLIDQLAKENNDKGDSYNVLRECDLESKSPLQKLNMFFYGKDEGLTEEEYENIFTSLRQSYIDNNTKQLAKDVVQLLKGNSSTSVNDEVSKYLEGEGVQSYIESYFIENLLRKYTEDAIGAEDYKGKLKKETESLFAEHFSACPKTTYSTRTIDGLLGEEFTKAFIGIIQSNINSAEEKIENELQELALLASNFMTQLRNLFDDNGQSIKDISVKCVADQIKKCVDEYKKNCEASKGNNVKNKQSQDLKGKGNIDVVESNISDYELDKVDDRAKECDKKILSLFVKSILLLDAGLEFENQETGLELESARQFLEKSKESIRKEKIKQFIIGNNESNSDFSYKDSYLENLTTILRLSAIFKNKFTSNQGCMIKNFLSKCLVNIFTWKSESVIEQNEEGRDIIEKLQNSIDGRMVKLKKINEPIYPDISCSPSESAASDGSAEVESPLKIDDSAAVVPEGVDNPPVVPNHKDNSALEEDKREKKKNSQLAALQARVLPPVQQGRGIATKNSKRKNQLIISASVSIVALAALGALITTHFMKPQWLFKDNNFNYALLGGVAIIAAISLGVCLFTKKSTPEHAINNPTIEEQNPTMVKRDGR